MCALRWGRRWIGPWSCDTVHCGREIPVLFMSVYTNPISLPFSYIYIPFRKCVPRCEYPEIFFLWGGGFNQFNRRMGSHSQKTFCSRRSLLLHQNSVKYLLVRMLWSTDTQLDLLKRAEGPHVLITKFKSTDILSVVFILNWRLWFLRRV